MPGQASIRGSSINGSWARNKLLKFGLSTIGSDLSLEESSISDDGSTVTITGSLNIVGSGLSFPHLITKAASATVRNSHDAEATSQSTVYVKAKTITLTNGLLGIQRFLFDLKTSNVANTANGRIYRNGVALGTEQSDVTGGYVTKSQDITQNWNPGDTVELWVKIDNAAEIVSVQNFRVAYDDAPVINVASVNS